MDIPISYRGKCVATTLNYIIIARVFYYCHCIAWHTAYFCVAYGLCFAYAHFIAFNRIVWHLELRPNSILRPGRLSDKWLNELEYTALQYCISLHCIALHCFALHCIAFLCTILYSAKTLLHCFALFLFELYCMVLKLHPMPEAFV